jgi:hypothetical protein
LYQLVSLTAIGVESRNKLLQACSGAAVDSGATIDSCQEKSMTNDSTDHISLGQMSRRELLRAAVAAPVIAALGPLTSIPVPLVAAERQVLGYDPSLTPGAETLGRWLRQLHDFGPIRATGTPQCRAFEEWLAGQFQSLGFSLERDQYRLTSWECDVERDCAITVVEDDGAKRTVEVVAYYPFAASTKSTGPVSGRVLYGGVNIAGATALVAGTNAAALANAIVVVDMPLGAGARAAASPSRPAAAAPGQPDAPPLPTFPSPLPSLGGGRNPAGQGGRPVMELLQDKCKALVFCFTDVANDTGRHNYLPFSDPHRRVPALWVGADGSRYLQSVSGKATMTLRCDATLTPDARADTLVATLKGRSDEVVFLTTHTDGPNEVNDNGALGVLALATYAAKVPAARRQRTLVCGLPTGHYASGAISDPKSGSGTRAGTRGIISKRPELVKRMVAQIALEQMGAMEWVDRDGKYVATGNVARERWIPTESVAGTMARLFVAATAGEDPKYSASFLSTSGAPGEGGSLRSANIPGIGLMGGPTFFFRADPRGVIDKLSPEVMRNQVAIATKMMVLMDRLTIAQLKGQAPITDADLFG